MALPSDYFSRVEGQQPIRSVEDFDNVVASINGVFPDVEFVWRGVHNAAFAMHSSLYRRTSRRLGHYANERELAVSERAIFQEAANTWNLSGGSALQLLAELQHTGTPTRLLDFSTDPHIALWFAVEQQRSPADRDLLIDETDGRVFAVQVRNEIPPDWVNSVAPPWWPVADSGRGTPRDWTRTVYTWRPAENLSRIQNQCGVLLVGGVPNTDTPLTVGERPNQRFLARDEIRACTSLPVRINRATRIERGERRGRPVTAPVAFTFTIAVGLKQRIREELAAMDSTRFNHGFVYQDLAGFLQFSSTIPPP